MNKIGRELDLVIATILRGDGITGVDTHIRQFRSYLDAHGARSVLITPFSWARPLTYPVFGARQALERWSPAVSVAWYLYWHEVFLRRALGKHLRSIGECVIYAQDPLAARAALGVRAGRHQRVVMAVHLRTSMANEWSDKNMIMPDGRVFRWIRAAERDAIPRLDGLVPVTRWARDALLSWLPEAGAVPYTVIGNFVSRVDGNSSTSPLGDLVTTGNLDLVKNHRFLLNVLAEANRVGKVYTLDIFGKGPCKGDLLSQARALGLEGQVRLRGFQPNVREFLPRYRAYVHAAYSESSSLAIMEAMAAGLPIVAGYLEPLAEVCEEGVETRFFRLEDPGQAAKVLIDLLECEPKRSDAAQAARARFERLFDAEIVAPQLMSFLEDTAARPVACRRPV